MEKPIEITLTSTLAPSSARDAQGSFQPHAEEHRQRRMHGPGQAGLHIRHTQCIRGRGRGNISSQPKLAVIMRAGFVDRPIDT